VMVTGDATATAGIVAREVGIEGAVCPPGPIPDSIHPSQFAVFAGVLPEDKYKLVKAFQKAGHIVGMCGDGANDAPALRQAQIGIAVSTATDVAKSAAGVVLTEPGLVGIVAAVKEGRITFQRILTYTLNSIIKKVVTVLFLVAGLIMTEHAILTPMLMVIVMVAGDFLAMSLTTDNVRPSQRPNTWSIGRLTVGGVLLGSCLLTFCTGVLAAGQFGLHLGTGALQTLAFILLVFGSQGTIYAIRERRHLWNSRPSLLLVGSSAVDIGIAATLAIWGIAMAPLPVRLVAGTLAAAALFALILDLIKVPVFAHLGIAESVATVTTDDPKREPTPTAQSAPTQTNPANAKSAAQAAPAPEVKAEAKPDAKAASALVAKAGGNPNPKATPALDIESKPPFDLTPKLVERVHALYEELGRQDVLAVQEMEQAQKASKEETVQ
jgi:H+-transporting ATPase